MPQEQLGEQDLRVTRILKKGIADMISDKVIKKIVQTLFIDPQEILGSARDSRKLDEVHLISIRLLSSAPMNGRGCKLDPLLLKIGFTGIDKDIEELTDEDLEKIIASLKRFDTALGTWTIIHDIAPTEEHPQWRLCADISPINCLGINIEKTAELPARPILCINCEGVGIFM